VEENYQQEFGCLLRDKKFVINVVMEKGLEWNKGKI